MLNGVERWLNLEEVFTMRGSCWVKVRNNRISYELILNRSITIIKGNSGTGKTNLLEMIDAYLNNGKLSGVHLSSNIKTLGVLANKSDWEYELKKHPNSIYFADENVKYILKKSFADLLKITGSYLVYITRSGKTGFLQYSINDIYEFKSSNNNIYLNTLVNLYRDTKKSFTPDLVITEDSTSGLDTLKHILNVDVKSSYGKDNVINTLVAYSSSYTNIYIIVDGAAYGSQIQMLLSEIKGLTSCNVFVFALESFEYLILSTRKFKKFCEDELENTPNYVESAKWSTWENYFEDLLCDLCKRYSNVKYEKVSWDRLNPFFKRLDILEDISLQLYDLNDSVKSIRIDN